MTECGSLRQKASGRTEMSCKSPTTFAWQNTDVALSSEQPVPATVDLSGWPSDRAYVAGRSGSWWMTVPTVEAPQLVVMPIDLDGDGRTDLLYPSVNTWRIAHALADGAFESIDTGIHDPAVTPMDYDGDGRTDLLLHVDSPTWQVRLSNGSGFDAAIDTGWDANGLLQSPRNVLPSEAVTQIVDLNGDGRDDILFCAQNWRVAYGGDSSPPRNVLAGDCRQPVLVIDTDADGDVEVLGSDGTHFDGTNLPVAEIREPAWLNPMTGVEQPIDQATRVIDINGDGLPDVLHAAMRPMPIGTGGAGAGHGRARRWRRRLRGSCADACVLRDLDEPRRRHVRAHRDPRAEPGRAGRGRRRRPQPRRAA